MKTLYLHVGNHKTGTTAVQNVLYKYYQDFLDAGIKPLSIDRFGGLAATNFTWAFDQSKITKSAAVRDIFYSAIDKKLESGVDKYVISSECFSWLLDEIEIKQLITNLRKQFDVIEILFFLRRQDRHAVSHYQQGLRTEVDRKFFACPSETNKALPTITPHVSKYLDYSNRIGMWSKHLSATNIHIAVYEDALENGGVLRPFFDFLNIDFIKIDMPKSNVGWDWISSKLARMLLDSKLTLSDLNLQELSIQREKFLPQREEAERFYLEFKDGNKELNDKFLITNKKYLFDESFEEYDGKSDEWNEEKASLVISHLLKLIENMK